jgi:hypothetical protein
LAAVQNRLAELERLLAAQGQRLAAQDERLATQQEEITQLRAGHARASSAAASIPPANGHGRGAVGAHGAEPERAHRRHTTRRRLLQLSGAAAAGVAAAVAAPQLAAAHPAMPADNPGAFSADFNLGHDCALLATGDYGANGIFADSTTGVDIIAGGTGRFQQTATIAHPGPPTASDGIFFSPGEQIRDINWTLRLCTAYGDRIKGIPGTFRQVAALAPGYTGGSVNLLPVAVRLLDTRGGSPVASHATAQFQAAGVGAIPAGAVAVFGHLVAALRPGVSPGDGSSAICWPAGQARPAAVNLVYNGGDLQGEYTGTLALAAVGAGGMINLYSQPITPGVAVDYIVDCFGFVM